MGLNHATKSLLGLAPDGVFPAGRLAAAAVRSYRTFSPLPGLAHTQAGRCVFCGTFPVPVAFAAGTVGVTHHRGSEVLGLSSPGAAWRRERPSAHPADGHYNVSGYFGTG